MTYSTQELQARVPPEILALRMERKRKRLSQSQVAKLAGLKALDTVGRLETGRTVNGYKPNKRTLLAVKRALSRVPEWNLPERMAQFRERLNLTHRGAAAMVGDGMSGSNWYEVEHSRTRRSTHEEAIEALLKRWEGRQLVETEGARWTGFRDCREAASVTARQMARSARCSLNRVLRYEYEGRGAGTPFEPMLWDTLAKIGPNDLPERMAAWRQAMGLSVKKAAKLAGISHNQWDRVQRRLTKYRASSAITDKVEALFRRWEREHAQAL